MEGRLNARPRLDGLLSGMPLVPGIASVGVLYGATSVDAGVPPWTVVATTLLVATGTAQWVALDLLSRDVAWWTIVLVGLAINLRFAVYSLHIGPWVSEWPTWRRLAYCGLLTDEGYALSMARRGRSSDSDPVAFLRWSATLALVVWGAWLVGTGVGALTGVVTETMVPAGLGLDRVVPLTLLCVLVLLATTPRHLAVAAAAGGVGFVFRGAPFGLGLLVAIAVGVTLGMAGGPRRESADPSNEAPTDVDGLVGAGS